MRKKVVEVDEEIFKGYQEVMRVKEQLENVTFFQGNLEEYEKWRGYECEILAPSFSEKGVYFPESIESYEMHNGKKPWTLNKRLLEVKDFCEKGMEAIVNVNYVVRVHGFVDGGTGSDEHRVGLPIRKKRD